MGPLCLLLYGAVNLVIVPIHIEEEDRIFPHSSIYISPHTNT